MESKPLQKTFQENIMIFSIESCRKIQQAETCDSLMNSTRLKAKQFLWNGASYKQTGAIEKGVGIQVFCELYLDQPVSFNELEMKGVGYWMITG